MLGASHSWMAIPAESRMQLPCAAGVWHQWGGDHKVRRQRYHSLGWHGDEHTGRSRAADQSDQEQWNDVARHRPAGRSVNASLQFVLFRFFLFQFCFKCFLERFYLLDLPFDLWPLTSVWQTVCFGCGGIIARCIYIAVFVIFTQFNRVFDVIK